MGLWCYGVRSVNISDSEAGSTSPEIIVVKFWGSPGHIVLAGRERASHGHGSLCTSSTFVLITPRRLA